MNFDELLEDVLAIFGRFEERVLEFVPNLIGAILILLIGIFTAYVLRAVVVRLIDKIHLLIPNRSIRSRVRGYIEEKPIRRIMGSIVYWILIFFFLTAATETLGLPVVTAWLSGLAGYLPKILSAALIGIAGVVGGMILRDLAATAAASAGIAYADALGRLVQGVVILVSILIGIDQIGVDVTLLKSALIIVIAALLFGGGLSFGLGSGAVVSNILASYYLQRIYKVGDVVRVGDREGRIIRITPLAVILDSPDGQSCVPARAFTEENTTLLPGGAQDE